MAGYCFKNLVFEGGGVKGIAYAGALEVLDKKGCLDRIEKVAGTSVGAITAAALALKFSVPEIQDILSETDFSSFRDGSFLPLLDYIRLFRKFGMYKGKIFERWFSEIISRKQDPHITFKDLAGIASRGEARLLYVTGSDMTTKKEVIYSNETTPDMKVIDALRVSISMPLFFRPIIQGSSILLDGGLYYNYPINLFDKDGYNIQTLGFRVDTTEEIHEELFGHVHPKEVDDFPSFMKALIGGLSDLANKRHLSEKDWHRTIYIDCEKVSSTDFDLTDEEKLFLMESGRASTIDYFDWYDNGRPLNK